MSKTEKVYERVSKELAKDPKQSVRAICRRLKLGDKGASLYYNASAKKRGKAKPKARAGAYQRLQATEAPADRQLVCVIGSPEQVRQFMAGGL